MSKFQNAVVAFLNALKIHMDNGVFKMGNDDLEEVVVLAWKSQNGVCTLTSCSVEAGRLLENIDFSHNLNMNVNMTMAITMACNKARRSGVSLSDSIVWQGFGASEIMSAIRFCEVYYSETED